jgi:hypothetical protein
VREDWLGAREREREDWIRARGRIAVRDRVGKRED